MIRTVKDINSTLQEIRSGVAGRNKIIKQLYYDEDLVNMVKFMLFKKGAAAADFDLVFDNSLMQFVKTVIKNPKLKIETSINRYIVGIAKYAWFYELNQRDKNKFENIEDYLDITSTITPESLIIDFDQKEIIQKLLLKLGKNCKEVLMYWANGYTMLEIAEMLEYKSGGMAKKKKHICFKKLLAYLDNNPHVKKVLR